MSLKNEDSSTQQRVLSIYWEAVLKIDPIFHPSSEGRSADEVEQDLRKFLLKYCVGVRQTPDARISRRALKAAAYERINGSK